MKRYIMLFLLVGLAAVAFTNPIMVYPIQALWFDYYLEPIIQFHGSFDNSLVHLCEFSTGGDFYSIPEDYVVIDNFINAQVVFPQLDIDRPSGTLLCRYSFEPETIYQYTWGQGNEVDLRPLYPGQAAMIVEGSYCNPRDYMWVKNDSVPSPWEEPSGEVQLNISAQYENGAPATGVPVYFSAEDWSVGSTNEAGIFHRTLRPAKNHIRIKDPLTNQYVYDAIAFPEPGTNQHIVVTVSSTSNQDFFAPSVFRIFPNVLRRSEGSSLRIECDKAPGSNSRLELYDLRGRKLDSRAYTGSGDYLLPELGTGVYFVKISDNGMTLGSQKILVLD